MRGLCLLLSLMLLTSCQGGKEEPPSVVFTPLGIEVSGVEEGEPVALLDDEGHTLLAYPPLASRDLLLIHPWEPGRTYVLRLGRRTYRLRSPSSRPLASVEVFAPLGSPGRRLLVFPDAGETGESYKVFSRKPCFKVGLLVTSFVPSLAVRLGGEELSLPEMARRLLSREMCLGEEEEGELALSLGENTLHLSFRRRPLDLRRAVRLRAWHLPTDESGLSLRHRREGLIAVPNPLFERLGYALGVRSRGFSRYDPFAYQALVFENRSRVPLNLLVRADFLDRESRKPVPGFYPPRLSGGGHHRQPVSLLYLPPGGRERVLLPIYVHQVPPGEYVFRVSVQVLGEEAPFLVRERRVGVTRGSPALAAGLLLILLSGAGYSLFVAAGLPRLLGRFRLRELTLVALAGAVAFGLDFLGGIVSNVCYALLGPFNILIGGLVTEVVHYLVFAAVLVLVPKPGFATLSGLLHYLMGLVLFGGVHATDPFFLGSALLVLEAALLLGGCYRRITGVRTVLALGAADAVNTLSSLVLHMTFYRLFFPGWYLWLSILVKGFLYTLIGAYLGLRVGRTLREAER